MKRLRPSFASLLAFGLLVSCLGCFRDSGEVKGSQNLATPDSVAPLDQQMQEWSQKYRQAMSPLIKTLLKSRVTTRLRATRERAASSVCNRLVANTYNVSKVIPTTPDPDIEQLLREGVLAGFVDGAKLCASGFFLAAETHLQKALGDLRKLERDLKERYFQEPLDPWREFSAATKQWCEDLEAKTLPDLMRLTEIMDSGESCEEVKTEAATIRSSMLNAPDPAVDSLLDGAISKIDARSCYVPSTQSERRYWSRPGPIKPVILATIDELDEFLLKEYGLDSCSSQTPNADVQNVGE